MIAVSDKSEIEPSTRIEFQPFWGLAALASVAALWRYAPSGLWLLLFIGIIVLCHEAGHLVVARKAGMRPTEFCWGFGPQIVAFNHNGCRYGIRALFLGGYVKLWGMTPSSVLPADFEERHSYRAASHLGRLATILAGPFVNLVMAVAAFAIARSLQGESAGQALLAGLDDLWFVIEATGVALWTWVTNLGSYAGAVFGSSGAEPPVRFMSPLAQAQQTGEVVAGGWVGSLQWFGILSAAIGGVNLLPLPPLDGAHAMVTVSEWLGQKGMRNRSLRLDVKRLEPLAYLTLALLIVLSVSALVLDLRAVGIG